MRDSAIAATIVLVVYLLVLAGVYVWVALALTRLFAKLGLPAWRAWVPCVNTYTLLEQGGRSGLWVIALFFPLISLVGVVMVILAIIDLNRRFGRSDAFAVLGVLVFPVWAHILGFGAAQPVGAASTQVYEQRVGALQASAPPVPPPVERAAAPQWVPPTSVLPTVPPPPVVAAPIEPPPVPAARAVSFAPASPAVPPVPVPPAPVVPPAPAPAPRPASTGRVDPWAPPAEALEPMPAADVDPRTVLRDVPPAVLPEVDELDRTVLSQSRARGTWTLTPAGGEPLVLAADVAVLGRNPTPAEGAQRVVLADPSKTVSKTHARLELREGTWFLTDLGSTNGVALVSASGEEIELASGAEGAIEGAFLLGDLRLELERRSR